VGRITSALIHQTGDWDLAEECAEDAFTQVLRRWGGVAAGAGQTGAQLGAGVGASLRRGRCLSAIVA
jgi:hypothetical protein